MVKRAGFGVECGDNETEHVAGILLKLYQMFVLDDAVLAEINPLIRTLDGDWYAADAKVEIDEDALYRQTHLGLPERLPSGRSPTKLEALAHEADRMDTRGAAGRMFFELPGGTIIVLASGGGTSVEALDALCLLGGKVAVFTEYSGNPSAEKVVALTKVALQYPGPIDAIWAVGGRANFTDIYETLVNGVMAAVRSTEGFDKTIPIVVRRAGPRDAEAFDALRRFREWEGYNIFLRGTATSVTDSARIVMHQAAIHAEMRKGGPK
jgi:succinyl-CoA synthetase beta subunit